MSLKRHHFCVWKFGVKKNLKVVISISNHVCLLPWLPFSLLESVHSSTMSCSIPSLLFLLHKTHLEMWKPLSAIQVKAAYWLRACASEGAAARIAESSSWNDDLQSRLRQAYGSKSPLRLVFFSSVNWKSCYLPPTVRRVYTQVAHHVGAKCIHSVAWL